MILTAKQIEDITGYKQPEKQFEWLTENGFKAKLNRINRVILYIPEFERVMLGGSRKTKTPNFEALYNPRTDIPKFFDKHPLTPKHIVENSKHISELDCAFQGLYFLVKDELIFYVGISKNVHNRLLQHRKSQPFDKVFCIEIKNEFLLEDIETYFIHKYAPESNMRFPPIPDYLDSYL